MKSENRNNFLMSKFLISAAILLISIFQVSCGGCGGSSYKKNYGSIHVGSTDSIVVGEEVYFDASEITNIPDPYLCSYEWDFGDSSMGERKGRSIVHAFMRPGKYTVTLTVKTGDEIVGSAESVVEIAGDYLKLSPRPADLPLLYLAFDDNLDDSGPGKLNASWSGDAGNFSSGVQNKALKSGGLSYVKVLTGPSLTGSGALTVSFRARKDAADGEGYLIRYPGVFSVRLGAGGEYLTGEVTTTNGTVTVEPWYLGATDTNWHHYVLIYNGTKVTFIFDGEEQIVINKCPTPLTGSLQNSSGSLFIGTSNETGSIFKGDIDEVKIYNRALTPEEISIGFEMWHADFHTRTAQYIFVKIPGELSSENSNRLEVTITGDNSYEKILTDRTSLNSEEKVLLSNSDLPKGNYTLQSKISNSTGTVLDVVSERFTKPYDGISTVGIDENNALRINGELFFPVTPFGLRNQDMTEWAAEKYINCLHSQGFWPQDYTPDGWEGYTKLGIDNGFLSIGPNSWGSQDTSIARNSGRNADIKIIEDYVTRFKSNTATMGWAWRDEPELGGDEEYCPAEVVRAWTRRCHDLDSQHPVFTNLVGEWIGVDNPSWWWDRSGNYLFANNKNIFGKRTFVADIYAMDYYPIEWAAPHTRGATVARLCKIIDSMRARLGNMVPIMSAVETCDINESDGDVRQPTPWHPTPAQLKMLIWVNVVHGIKGITWFPWHSGTPVENYPVMTEFVDQITRLTPIVLGPEINPVVTVNASGVRIDTMVRQYAGKTYLFAVRVDESDITGKTIGSSVTATLSVSGVTSGTVTVFDEARSLTLAGGVLTDTFQPNGVHIYIIE